MVLIAYAFMNKVISFYSFYQYAHEQTPFLQMVALIHLELEVFWSFLAIMVIKNATQVTKEVELPKFLKSSINYERFYRVKKLHGLHMT